LLNEELPIQPDFGQRIAGLDTSAGFLIENPAEPRSGHDGVESYKMRESDGHKLLSQLSRM
jgi:hypothetical protein